MTVVRWTLSDPVTSATYVFHINPASGGAPQYKKTTGHQSTTAPGGNVLRWEGADEPQVLSIQGTILEEAHYQAMVTWWQKRYPVVLTDHIGRSMTIYITEFLPETAWVGTHPFRHKFTMSYTVLSMTDL